MAPAWATTWAQARATWAPTAPTPAHAPKQ